MDEIEVYDMEPVEGIYEVAGRRRRRRWRRFGAALGGPLAWAASRRRAHRLASRRRAAAQRPPEPMTAGSTLVAGGDRIVPLGLGSVSVPAGGTTTLETICQRSIQPQRLVIQDPSGQIVVNQILVGVKNQIAGVGDIPASTFAATAQDTGILFDPATPGTQVSIVLTNPGASDVTVSAAMLGTAAD